MKRFSMLFQLVKTTVLIVMVTALTQCTSMSADDLELVQLPYLKNSASECYYLDEFMPVPDSLVAGKYGRLNLRYYTYKMASYKDWDERQVVLSFYSQDDRCWSLYEESYVNN